MYICVCLRGGGAVSVMAVGIMSASLLSLCLLQCFFQVFSQGDVFQGPPQAHGLFLRSKRANQFLVEEILQGNLERECYEERCNYEEAREYFEDTEKTIAFWTVYYDGDQCEPNPCLNGGNCTDKMGGFSCSCTTPHYGPVCELGGLGDEGQPSSAPQNNRPEISECPTEGPTACHQLCTASYHSFTCSCMPGFKLQTDGRSCRPEVDFPCGRLPDAAASTCRHGNCPWQVTLLNSTGALLCGGVVLGRRSILTTARCLHLDSGFDLGPSNFYVAAGNKRMRFPVRAVYLHSRFRSDHHDNDLALLELASPLTFGPALIHLCLPTKDFCENILMHSGRTGIAERPRGGQNQNLVYMTLDDCRRQLNVSHPLSNKMFCMRSQNGPSRNQNGVQGRQNDPSGNKHGPLRNQNLTQRSPDGVQRNLKVLFENQNGTHQSQNGSLGNQNETHASFGSKNGVPVRIQNQIRDPQSAMPHTAENHSSSKSHKSSPAGGRSRSDVNGRPCGGLLPGSPIATVEQGTVFLTGLLISSSPGCDSGGGLVFAKMSRYLSWIRPRLEAAEDHMTPQVSQYPESR